MNESGQFDNLLMKKKTSWCQFCWVCPIVDYQFHQNIVNKSSLAIPSSICLSPQSPPKTLSSLGSGKLLYSDKWLSVSLYTYKYKKVVNKTAKFSGIIIRILITICCILRGYNRVFCCCSKVSTYMEYYFCPDNCNGFMLNKSAIN